MPDSKTSVPPVSPARLEPPPGRPPRGLIWRDGKWHPRWSGFLVLRKLHCWNDHNLYSSLQRKGGRVPAEGAVACGYKRPPGNGPACPAMVYVFRIRAGRIFAMDLTEAEENMIDLDNMDLDEIIVYFGLTFAERK